MLVIEPAAKNGNASPFCKVRRVAYDGNSETLRREVGCGKWLEALHIGGGLDLWIDADGKLGEGKPFNPMATRLYGMDTVVGAACVLSHDNEGNEVDLTDEEEKLVLGWLGIDSVDVVAT